MTPTFRGKGDRGHNFVSHILLLSRLYTNVNPVSCPPTVQKVGVKNFSARDFQNRGAAPETYHGVRLILSTIELSP